MWRKVLPVLAGLAITAFLLLLLDPNLDKRGVSVPRNRTLSISLPDLDGRTWKLADQRGKIVLVNFWATWCTPCRNETPGLVRLANQYKIKGLEVVGISFDEDGPQGVRDFVAEYQIPYPILLPPEGHPLTSRIESLPTSLLIDRAGKVRKTYVGAVSESAFRADVDRLLNES
jgi:cytochrome c biogenesis protein CcmG/thiol:disulfide interchange protein DsbE